MPNLFFDDVAPIQLWVLDAIHAVVECKKLLGQLLELPVEACAQQLDLAAIYQQAEKEAQKGLELSQQLLTEARPDVLQESITELAKLSSELNLLAKAAYLLLPEGLQRQPSLLIAHATDSSLAA